MAATKEDKDGGEGWKDAWIERCREGKMEAKKDGWVDGWIGRWMNGRMDRRTDV